jgi:hypothetical protein
MPLDCREITYRLQRAVPDAKGLSTITFVLIDKADQRTIQGYYSLSATGVEFATVPSDVGKSSASRNTA